MIQAGDVIENPVTGERLVFRKTSRETNGEAGRARDIRQAERLRRGRPRSSAPGGAVRDSRAGPSASASVGRRSSRARASVVTVPAGTAHKFWNAGDDEAHFVCEVRPALAVRAADRDDVRARGRRQDEPQGDAESAATCGHRAAPLRRRPPPVPACVDAADGPYARCTRRPGAGLPGDVCPGRRGQRAAGHRQRRLEMRGSRIETRIFLFGLFLVLLVIAAAGWVVQSVAAIARWSAGLVEAS